jgi:hypothetical protein
LAKQVANEAVTVSEDELKFALDSLILLLKLPDQLISTISLVHLEVAELVADVCEGVETPSDMMLWIIKNFLKIASPLGQYPQNG